MHLEDKKMAGNLGKTLLLLVSVMFVLIVVSNLVA